MNKAANKRVSNRKGAKKAEPAKPKAFSSTFYLDCRGAVGTNLVLLPDVEKYIVDMFKPKKGAKAGELKGRVVVSSTKDDKIRIQACEAFPKRYVKYLAKRFLCKMGVIDYFRIIATGKDTYEIRHYDDASADAE